MNYLIDVTEEELGVIARALMDMPYKTVANLFAKINQQVTEQQNPTAPEPEPEAEAPVEAEEEIEANGD